MFVKICGITNAEDALRAIRAGADALGFVFTSSPRQVKPETVSEILRALPPSVLMVGVFRNEDPDRVVEIVRSTGLSAAQLHGEESLSEVEYVAARVPTVIQAFAAGDERINRAGRSPADIIIVDSPKPGSGMPFDWSLLGGITRTERMMLAGGLNPDNVADAIALLRPWGVDVSSGVEATPGRKDPEKLRLFVRRAKRRGVF